jgi:16S rRNA (guanine527-N7)-methyltransferase
MEQLEAGARHLGLTLNSKQLALFQVFYQDLVAWNQRFNLTAITEYEQVQIRHFVDSLSCLLAFEESHSDRGDRPLRCIDIGSGAGFPGLPIKIYCPQVCMVLLEATGKKVTFLEHIVSRLGMRKVQPLKGRAEEVAHDPDHRERYDVVLARAVAELSVLAEYALPLCSMGGLVIAQKGAGAREETQAAEYAVSVLGGRLKRVIPVELLGLAEARNLIVIEKAARTPTQYPRRPGMPAKRPLKARRAVSDRDRVVSGP